MGKQFFDGSVCEWCDHGGSHVPERNYYADGIVTGHTMTVQMTEEQTQQCVTGGTFAAPDIHIGTFVGGAAKALETLGGIGLSRTSVEKPASKKRKGKDGTVVRGVRRGARKEPDVELLIKRAEKDLRKNLDNRISDIGKLVEQTVLWPVEARKSVYSVRTASPVPEPDGTKIGSSWSPCFRGGPASLPF